MIIFSQLIFKILVVKLTIFNLIICSDPRKNESLMLKEVRLEQFDFDEADLHEVSFG